EAQTFARGQRAVRQALAEVFPVEPLHGEVPSAVPGLTMRDVGDDAGVAELGQQLRFTEESLCFVRFGRTGVHELEADRATAVAVDGAVNRAHATAAGGALDLEAIGDEVARRDLRIFHLGQYAQYGAERFFIILVETDCRAVFCEWTPAPKRRGRLLPRL